MRASKTERSRPSVILSKPEETGIQKEYRFPFAFISLKKIATSLEISLPELINVLEKDLPPNIGIVAQINFFIIQNIE